MKIFGMGVPELLIILAVILLIFGPKNLPKLGRSLGQAVKGLRKGLGSDKTAEAEGENAEIVDMASDEEAVQEPVTHPKKVVVKKVVAK